MRFVHSVAFLALLAVPAVASASSYNPINYFTSTSAGADGPFSYAVGTSASHTSMTGFGSNFFNQYGPYRSDPSSNAVIIFSPNGVDTGSVSIPGPGNTRHPAPTATELLLHPGSGTNNDALLIFTAPTAGKYDLAGAFTRRDVGDGNGAGVTATVYVGGIPYNIFSILNRPYGYSKSFNDTVLLAAGEQLIFDVNDNGQYASDSTGLALTITQTPEPSSLMLLGTGVLGAAGIARRKFRRA